MKSDVGLPPSEEELLQLQSDIKKVISMLIEQGLDMQLPDFETTLRVELVFGIYVQKYQCQ